MAGGTATVVIAAHVHTVRRGPAPGDLDAGFWTLLVLALVPALIYVLGLRDADLSLYYGLALVLITASGWAIALASDDPVAGVYVGSPGSLPC